ncbi:MAG: hypothetical protein HQK78_19275 [Desulfobacterales bacterium]|nr:hypothetical protein [Desulfobacterales bacterium]
MQKIFILFLLTICGYSYSYSEVYQNFDSNDWIYSSNLINPNENIKTCGFYSKKTYGKIYDYFTYYRNTYNNSHMGFETYGYLAIDEKTAVIGNSLRIIVTGGKNSSGEYGAPIFSKEDFLKSDKKEIPQNIKVGHPTIYFCNTSNSDSPVYFPYAKGCNRLSLYVKMPKDLSNGTGGSGNPPQLTVDIGPFNGVGGHWYHGFYNQGGGWTHILVDGHPIHNNSWADAKSYPYPSSSLRDMGTEYFSTMYRWYITFLPYEGISVPPYSVWIDEIEFYNDPEPQNNETINSPAITYHPEPNFFEVGFSDKYKNNEHSDSKYEVRYSFSQITNDNYKDAKPVIVQPDDRYNISMNIDGQFNKFWTYYPNVWAAFKLSPQDETKLTSGTRVYFAIKDISKRPYNLGTFDREGDNAIVPSADGKKRIDLIKRIDYIVDKNVQIVPPKIDDNKNKKRPQKVKNLRIIS